MRIDVVTLFPERVAAVTQYGVTGRASERGMLELATWNPRDYTQDRYRTVDDRPYGGGPGMVLLYAPLRDTIRAAQAAAPQPVRRVLLSPQGRRLEQTKIREWAAGERLLLVTGRYEGVDERLVAHEIDEEVSLGDFVMSGGEIAAMAVVDAVARLLPGVVGAAASVEQDSFSDGLLDCPHYTRPERVDGLEVPAVLLGGDHAAIRRWRHKQALGRTFERRPDLLEGRELDAEERALLEEYLAERRESE